jgi:hypothetical protein
MSKLQFLIKKRYKKLSSVFGHQNPGSGLDPDPYPDQYPNPDSLEILDLDSINPDPQLWGCVSLFCTKLCKQQKMNTCRSQVAISQVQKPLVVGRYLIFESKGYQSVGSRF